MDAAGLPASEDIDLAHIAIEIARAAGRPAFDAWGFQAWHLIPAALHGIPPVANTDFVLADAADMPGVALDMLVAGTRRQLPPIRGIGPLPPGFGRPGMELSVPPMWRACVPGGTLVQYGQTPLVLGGDGRTILRDLGTRYAALVHHHPIELGPIVAQARDVAGAVFAIGDDVWPPNFAHFLLDWLPRLSAVRERADASVAVLPLHAPFVRPLLHASGFDDARIIEVPQLRALRAETLIVTDDRPSPPHPGFRASAWALRFVRATVGRGIVRDGAEARDGEYGLYVSRADSSGRNIVNEDALLDALAPLRVRRVLLSRHDTAEQARLFAGARWILGVHGAGMANLVFATRGARVVEIFPRTHGTDAFRMVAHTLGLDYRYLICDALVGEDGVRPEFLDLRVDVDAVVALLG